MYIKIPQFCKAAKRPQKIEILWIKLKYDLMSSSVNLLYRYRK